MIKYSNFSISHFANVQWWKCKDVVLCFYTKSFDVKQPEGFIATVPLSIIPTPLHGNVAWFVTVRFANESARLSRETTLRRVLIS